MIFCIQPKIVSSPLNKYPTQKRKFKIRPKGLIEEFKIFIE